MQGRAVMALDKRIRWRCRRGMRETDLMLERFLRTAGEALDDDARTSLERLLERPDREILDWLTGRTPAPDAAIAELVGRIRAASPLPPP